MPAVRLPTGFRRRLTIAFVLVAAVAAGVVALGSSVLIERHRERSFTTRSTEKAALSLISTPPDLTVARVDDLLAQFRRRGGFETLVVAGDVTYASVPGLGIDQVPLDVRREAVATDPGAAPAGAGSEDVELARGSGTLGGDPVLVIGGAAPGGSAQLYFFFSEADLRESIRDFRTVLLLGWIAAVAGAAAAGHLVARRTLRPVNEAARASQALAEGLLDTRLALSSDDEFGRWASSFNTMAAALEDTIADLSHAAERERRFTADVAHELRTPLTGMVSAAELLEDELASSGPAATSARLLIDDVRRLRVLVDELLELARFDAGQEQARVEPLSLEPALRAAARPWDGRSTVELEVDPDAVVLADPARFRRVVSNLIANAHAHGAGPVEVRGRRDGDVVVVDVRDHGPGLGTADAARVFDRFFKADRSRSSSGSGLGLAIALEHARVQGGTLTARDLDDGGACFSLALPAAAPPPGPSS